MSIDIKDMKNLGRDALVSKYKQYWGLPLSWWKIEIDRGFPEYSVIDRDRIAKMAYQWFTVETGGEKSEETENEFGVICP